MASNFITVTQLELFLNLAELRHRSKKSDGSKVTQQDLATALSRTRITISRWEAGKNLDGINSSDIVAIAKCLDVTVEVVIQAIENTKNHTQN